MFLRTGRCTYLFMLVVLLCFSSELWSQTVDISGNWVLDLGKSRLASSSKNFRGSIFIITKHNDNYHLLRYHMAGEKIKRIGFSLRADGQTRRLKILFKSKLERTSAGLVASIWRKNFSNVVTYNLGTEPNELVADEYFKSPKDSHHNIWVFKRVVTE